MAYTTINKSTDHFNTKIWTGNGGTQSITGVGFQPDLIWGKGRSATGYHILSDVIRGITKYISTNSSGVEATATNLFTSFDSNGFTIGSSGSLNASTDTFVAWNWKANGAGSANTDGSINSTVSANTTSGFSIVSYTGTGANATVGHGLGVAPKVILIKVLNEGSSWGVYHDSIGNGKYLRLNSTNEETASSSYWNSTSPTSSVFSLGSEGNVNQSTKNFIAYAFAEKQGFSKFGSYTGNGNANGPFNYTGFKPAFVIFKRTDSAVNWSMVDNKRDTFNPTNKRLFPDLSNSENNSLDPFVDILSNGFKLQTSSTAFNSSGGSYIYMAFAEAPLVGSNNVPCTAR